MVADVTPHVFSFSERGIALLVTVMVVEDPPALLLPVFVSALAALLPVGVLAHPRTFLFVTDPLAINQVF
jgi:hypothetical protein